MKLSDAMRLADEMGLPNSRYIVQRDVRKWGGEKPPCCAIGGANIASRRVSIEPINGIVPRAQARRAANLVGWGYEDRIFFTCPDCGKRGLFAQVISHLYDDHRWSRTQIADWLDTLE